MVRDGSARTILIDAILKEKLQVRFAISPSHSTLTLDQPVLALTLYSKVPSRLVTRVETSQSLV